jgi:hypothetical protein
MTEHLFEVGKMNKYSGSCLCKAVTFEIKGEFKGFYLCHCSRCRKDTGSAHAANLFSKTAELQWKSGEAHVKPFAIPDTRFTKAFCDQCGSPVPVVQENVRLVVPAGCLDCDVGLVPDAHIFMGSKADWDHDLTNVATFEEFPSQ